MGTRMTWPSLGPRAFVMVVLRWVGGRTADGTGKLHRMASTRFAHVRITEAAVSARRPVWPSAVGRRVRLRASVLRSFAHV